MCQFPLNSLEKLSFARGFQVSQSRGILHYQPSCPSKCVASVKVGYPPMWMADKGDCRKYFERVPGVKA